MLESCKTAEERWGGVHQLIDRWLDERRQLIHAFVTLRDAPGHTAHLRNFCDLLVDYASAGHFEIYQQLIREAEDFNDTAALELIGRVYPRIESITRQSVDFNDRHAGPNGDSDRAALPDDLNALGALLRERFELEDCLIEVLHNAHRELLPAS